MRTGMKKSCRRWQRLRKRWGARSKGSGEKPATTSCWRRWCPRQGEASEGDMRKLLSLLREGKSEARCSFDEAGSCMSSNRVEVDLEGFFHVGGTRYEISGGVSNEEGDVTLSGMTTVGGIGYFCEDDWMKGKSECVSDSHASQWAEQAGVQMTESQVLRGVVSALEVLLGETQVGDAKDSNYGVDPVQQILEWVGEAVA